MRARDHFVLLIANVLIYLRFPAFTIYYVWRQRRWPDFARPRDYPELVQWRKLFDRNPFFPVLCDKLAVKAWIKERMPDIAVPETVWVGTRYQDLPDEFLSPDYVIKLNNGSSTNYFPHRQGADRASFERVARKWFTPGLRGWFRVQTKHETAYTAIPLLIFVERRVTGEPLVDISVRVCNGTATVVSCATDFKTGNDRVGFFWPDGEPLLVENRTGRGDLAPDFRIPSRFAEAITLAERISEDFDFLRVDFIAADDELYLGEITLYPASGYGPNEWRTELVYRHWLDNIGGSWPLREPARGLLSLYVLSFRRWAAERRKQLGRTSEFGHRMRSMANLSPRQE